MNASMTRTAGWLRLLAGTALVAIGATAAARADETHWIHVRVVEKGDKTETVRINLPVTLLESVAPAIHQSHIRADHIKVGDTDMDRADLRAMWEAVRKAGDAEYVTVESEGQTVRVARQGKELVIRVNENDDRPGVVKARLPIAVVDALFSGPGDELNFVAALRALQASGSGDLLTVDDGPSSVRVWIDQSNTGSQGGSDR